MNKTAVCTECNCIRKCRTHHDLKSAHDRFSPIITKRFSFDHFFRDAEEKRFLFEDGHVSSCCGTWFRGMAMLLKKRLSSWEKFATPP